MNTLAMVSSGTEIFVLDKLLLIVPTAAHPCVTYTYVHLCLNRHAIILHKLFDVKEWTIIG